MKNLHLSDWYNDMAVVLGERSPLVGRRRKRAHYAAEDGMYVYKNGSRCFFSDDHDVEYNDDQGNITVNQADRLLRLWAM
jgi:hypothetical protein